MIRAALLYVLALAAALVPLRTTSETRVAHAAFPGWSAAPIPLGAVRVQLGEREARFARGFPGEIAAFADGTNTWVVRWVQHPTRKLHPAIDCLRALGFRAKPGPILAEHNAARWSTATATRDGENVSVRERIVDTRGQQWTDISAWFWDAAFGRSIGPWWAVTVFSASAPDTH